MKKKYIFIIIFIFTVFIYFICLSKFFISFYFTITEGDDYYHSKVTENVLIFNYGQNVKSVGYCFTDEARCNDFLNYDGDFSKRIINVKIDYPDSVEGKRICVLVTSENSSKVHCNNSIYVVDSISPSITSLYDDIILSGGEEDLENLFKVSSNTGIKEFNCEYKDGSKSESSYIECRAVGNNTLETVYTQKAYLEDYSKLEGKKILFAGDSITEADSIFDNFKGWSGRVGLGNYMDWYNSGVGGATIAKSKRHITDQIMDSKDEYYDYVILQGGINDTAKGTALGTMSDSFDVEDFDNSTYAGGLEELFYYTKLYNKDSKIGFIITYQTPNSDWGDEVVDRSSWAELTREICNKWDIPYLDLYDGVVYENGEVKTYSEILKVETGELFHNQARTQVHLSGAGYDVISKYISIWIKTL